jgi:hypothetical protein
MKWNHESAKRRKHDRERFVLGPGPPLEDLSGQGWATHGPFHSAFPPFRVFELSCFRDFPGATLAASLGSSPRTCDTRVISACRRVGRPRGELRYADQPSMTYADGTSSAKVLQSSKFDAFAPRTRRVLG